MFHTFFGYWKFVLVASVPLCAVDNIDHMDKLKPASVDWFTDQSACLLGFDMWVSVRKHLCFAQEFHQVWVIWPTFQCHSLMFSWAGPLCLSIRLVSQATRWPLSLPAPLLSIWLGWTEESHTVPLHLPWTLEVDSPMRANQCVFHIWRWYNTHS